MFGKRQLTHAERGVSTTSTPTVACAYEWGASLIGRRQALTLPSGGDAHQDALAISLMR
jgi:hypothetical protein